MSNSKEQFITDRKFIQQLKALLERECALYRDFINLLGEQRRGITNFQADKIEILNLKRARLHRQMQTAHAERLILMQRFPDSAGKKLSTLIKSYCLKADQKVLLSLAQQLRELVLEAKSKGAESNGVVGFALNVVNGSLSLLWQATQHVSKSYSRSGRVQEAYVPRHSRGDNVLKQA